MGSVIAASKVKKERAANDFYPTPTGLVEELIKTGALDGCELAPALGWS